MATVLSVLKVCSLNHRMCPPEVTNVFFKPLLPMSNVAPGDPGVAEAAGPRTAATATIAECEAA